jgi:hypothetical protein
MHHGFLRLSPPLLIGIAVLFACPACGGDPASPDGSGGEPAGGPRVRIVAPGADLEAPPAVESAGDGEPATEAARYPARDFLAAFKAAGVAKEQILVKKARTFVNRKHRRVEVSWEIDIGRVTADELEKALTGLMRKSLRYLPWVIELEREGTGVTATVRVGHHVSGVDAQKWKTLPLLPDGPGRSALSIWRDVSAITAKVREGGTALRLNEVKLSRHRGEIAGLVGDPGKLEEIKAGLLALDYVNDLGPAKSYVDPKTQRIRFRMEVPFE